MRRSTLTGSTDIEKNGHDKLGWDKNEKKPMQERQVEHNLQSAINAMNAKGDGCRARVRVQR
jgi:hypothetical protein